MPQDVTITLTRYTEPDTVVLQALTGAMAQIGIAGEVLFVEQNTQRPLDPGSLPPGKLPLRIVCAKLMGLSQARNLALREARHRLVLFLDADAVPDPDWASHLAAALAGPQVAVAGSRIEPGWQARPPAFTRAHVLRDQYSLLELGTATRPVAKVVGAAFGVDTAKLPPGMSFDEQLGRREGRLYGGEESDFCARVRASGQGIVYAGCARVIHLVSPERLRLGWILKRMVYAGYGRARLGGSPSPSRRPSGADLLFAPLYLPPYVAGWLWGKIA